MKVNLVFGVLFLFATKNIWGHSSHFSNKDQGQEFKEWEQDGESVIPKKDFSSLAACQKATASQLAEVNRGNLLLNEFLNLCARKTNNSKWCKQVARPNPSSISTFRCTYGQSQPHQLIHPDRSTWQYAYKAIELIKELEAKKIKTCEVYNWWRPAPYNGNVGGAAGRHPYGTSVDVRFCSLREMEKAFTQLCTWRKQGRLRALGYYGSTGLHFGIGDHTANTWGKSCK